MNNPFRFLPEGHLLLFYYVLITFLKEILHNPLWGAILLFADFSIRCLREIIRNPLWGATHSFSITFQV